MLEHVVGRLETALTRNEEVECGVTHKIALTKDEEVELSMPVSDRWKNASKLMVVI